jgi:isopentenyl phosphate kinase
MNSSDIIFLKLGGSLITDKDQISTARLNVIDRIAKEIRNALNDFPNMQLIIGHGSGSFGHQAAKKYNTREGVFSAKDWLGFTQVWKQANKLNQIVINNLSANHIPAISFPPSSSAITNNGKITSWNLEPMKAALGKILIPVVQGDVVIDSSLGGTIVSTEEVFTHLASTLKPKRILLAGIEAGVWKDYPTCKQLIKTIDNKSFPEVAKLLTGSKSTDVTGGMQSKVEEMLSLVTRLDKCEVEIFSGLAEDSVYKALSGNSLGTIIRK